MRTIARVGGSLLELAMPERPTQGLAVSSLALMVN
jgi:hypothetical protein